MDKSKDSATREVLIPAAGDAFSGRPKPSTRHHRCDLRFLELLEQDFGIRRFYLISAFLGVPAAPKKQCIRLCEWAMRTAHGNPEEAGDALRAWARKHRVGTFDPRLVGGGEGEAR